jgi:hypothetical protein
MDKLSALFRSRKFYAALVGFVLVIVRAYVPDLPFTDEQLLAVVLIVVSYIVGTGIEDSGLLRRG